MASFYMISIMVLTILATNSVVADIDPFQRFLNQGKKATSKVKIALYASWVPMLVDSQNLKPPPTKNC